MEVAQLNLSAAAVPASEAPLSGVETVGFGARAGARIIDLILHIGVSLVAGIFLGLIIVIVGAITGTETAPLIERMASGGAAATILAMFGFVLYSSICEGLFGATAGKYILGLVVLSEDQKPCTYVQAVGRSFAFYIDSLFFGLIAYFSMKDSPKDQRYGDKWCRTIVVKRATAPHGVLRSPLRFVGVFFLGVMLDGIALAAGSLL